MTIKHLSRLSDFQLSAMDTLIDFYESKKINMFEAVFQIPHKHLDNNFYPSIRINTSGQNMVLWLHPSSYQIFSTQEDKHGLTFELIDANDNVRSFIDEFRSQIVKAYKFTV